MRTHFKLLVLTLLWCALTACATRPINPPIASVPPDKIYNFERKGQNTAQESTLVAIAFSGGGTRAAAFSYGVLETLRKTEFVNAQGERSRMIDHIDVITGVSGGSFTALAYGLYGEQLFDQYESRFLKRNVQGEIIGRSLNPLNCGAISPQPAGAALNWRPTFMTKFYSTVRPLPILNVRMGR